MNDSSGRRGLMDPAFCAEWCRFHGGPAHAVHESGAGRVRSRGERRADIETALTRALVRSGVAAPAKAQVAAEFLLREISEQQEYEINGGESYARPLFGLLP